MLVEEQRYIHEDLERLEQGIAERMSDEPRHIRDRLNRDHEVAQLLDQLQKQSTELLALYEDRNGVRSQEVLRISAGDPFEEFYRQANEIKEYHDRYPHEQAENSEVRYRPRKTIDDQIPYIVEGIFSGEEAYGRFFDMHTCHESYLNLLNVKRLAYVQYLEIFDNFAAGAGGLKRSDKTTDQYFKYLGELMEYLESFMRRTRPLENLEKVFSGWDQEFEDAWVKDEVQGWQIERPDAKHGGAPRNLSTPEAVWCDACEKEFKNENVYKGHLNGRKHVKAAEELAKGPEGAATTTHASSAHRMKERAVAEREFRVKKLVSAMSVEREDTRVNVERRQGMTDRERQQELENLFNSTAITQAKAEIEEEEAENGEEKIYNPLKLPLAWDGKPIPFWLYRLHGLGLELSCEICGNFVYRGRRAFDKHFNEAQHINNLKRLGISNPHLFRDITGIEEAVKLWEKIQRDQKAHADGADVVQMEDAQGNVMPEKVYNDLKKQGLL